MTATSSLPKSSFSPEILAAQAAVAENPGDLMAHLSLASALEQGEFWAEALAEYQEVQRLDQERLFTATLDKAIADLQSHLGPTDRPGAGEVASSQSYSSYRLGGTEQIYPEEIVALQRAVEENPQDLVAKVVLANALEQGGYLLEAMDVYQEIIQQDQEGSFKGSAEKALEELRAKLTPTQASSSQPEAFFSYRHGLPNAGSKNLIPETEIEQGSTPDLLQRILDLPIASKQFIAFLTCSALSVVAVVGAGIAISLVAGRDQLKRQAAAELAVTSINYDIKINQMGLGFRGQSDNPAIIQAAQFQAQGQPLPLPLRQQLQTILKNEVNNRKIEYATLVGKDARIIVNANRDRQGQLFDPDGLVKDVLALPRQIKATTLISTQDLTTEAAPYTQNIKTPQALIRFVLTPVQDPKTRQVLGVLVAGDVVNGKTPIVNGTVETLGGGYSAIYMTQPKGNFDLVTSVLSEPGTTPQSQPRLLNSMPLTDFSLLRQSQKSPKADITGRTKLNRQPLTLAIRPVLNLEGQPIAFLIRGTPETRLEALLQETFLLQLGIGVVVLLFSAFVASVLGRALTRPLQQLQETAQQLGTGEMGIRAEVKSRDEVGQLAYAFNEMAERIEANAQTIQASVIERQEEAEAQRRQKEELQEGVIRLLLDIEEAAKGDLTVKTQIETGAVGSIADAFNATIAGLRSLVEKVLTTAEEVNQKAQQESQSVSTLSEQAIAQTQDIEAINQAINAMADSLESIDRTAQNAADIARQGNEAAQEGQVKMDQTVNSIYKVRGQIAELSKKSKRLAESSQEISKIVSIIAGISEKTNLLAFNASIEAARAGENGQGFRIVADEVRRLAEMVTVSAQEIEQVILRIQEETAQMSQMMEESTSEVVTGTQLVQNTKETLQNLAQISREIDTLLAAISTNTESQRETSQQVTEAMAQVALVAKTTSDRSQVVSDSLQELVETAKSLENTASQFKIA